jgi:hypothetical protein
VQEQKALYKARGLRRPRALVKISFSFPRHLLNNSTLTSLYFSVKNQLGDVAELE